MISVVVPAYNAERFVGRAVASVMAQRGGAPSEPSPTFEIVLVDDGSSDHTVAEAVMAVGGDDRLTVIRQSNAGVCRARNRGLERASGSHVLFLDADDLLTPWALATLWKALVGGGDLGESSAAPAFSYGAAVRVDEWDRVPARPVVAWSKDDRPEAWLRGNPVGSGSGALMAVETARSVGGFDESMRGEEGEALADWLFYLRLRERGPSVYCRTPTVGYRRVSGSMSADPALMLRSQKRFQERVEEEIAEVGDLGPRERSEIGSQALVNHGAYHLSEAVAGLKLRQVLPILSELGLAGSISVLPALVRSPQSVLYWRRALNQVRTVGLNRRAVAESARFPMKFAQYCDQVAASQLDGAPSVGPSNPTRTEPRSMVEAMIDVSICIPSYNREAKLRTLLASIAADVDIVNHRAGLSTDHGCEVVVMLDGSTDGSEAMLKRLAATYPLPLRWIRLDNRGRSAARNTLIDEARGRLLWFIDDDHVVPPGTFDRHRRWDRTRDEVMFGPSYVTGANEGLALFYAHRWRDLAKRDRIDDAEMISFANTTVPAEIMRRHRFDESFVGYGFEDYELAVRMLADGVKFGFDAEALVTHDNDKSGFESLQNIREEGFNRVQLHRRHPDLGAFALDLRPGRLSKLLGPLAERGWTRPLWWGAHVVRAGAIPLRGWKAFRVIRVADDLALYSGLALAWGDGTDPGS